VFLSSTTDFITNTLRQLRETLDACVEFKIPHAIIWETCNECIFRLNLFSCPFAYQCFIFAVISTRESASPPPLSDFASATLLHIRNEEAYDALISMPPLIIDSTKPMQTQNAVVHTIKITTLHHIIDSKEPQHHSNKL
jgi:hypothetical protein